MLKLRFPKNQEQSRLCCSHSRSLSKSKFELPKLAHCQSASIKSLPKPLENIKSTLQVDLGNSTMIQTNHGSDDFESARLGTILKDINTSLGFSQLPAVIRMIQQRIQHLKQLRQRTNELQVLCNTYQQSMEMLQTSQTQIIDRVTKRQM
ncbi:Hypothetical_protein [Hexamita inflata]|uniref:Hypothetical_protein n=1 Tax=Hexamita inflata TaxID=28002 RepID=A0AA86TUM9_9EUKA|nr:Hypothetical protein HINF_LOCUS17130 [Hexamita inflata]CAI9950277.1 Hypothetical protein HINF_LOCUS37922 [Hexamita inflata]